MPEVPALSRVDAGPAGLADRVAAALAPGGPIARALAGFEARPSQIEMARAVAGAFERGGIVLAEAGTGTGKTLAYLTAAVLSGHRTLVSTGTKNLQEQIYFKDIPALRDALGIPFTAAYMKGRANYLCLHRLDQLAEGPPGARPDGGGVFLRIIREWAGRTETGDRAELDELPEDLPFWNEVAATAETCLGAECPHHGDCFVTRMRQQAAAADLVIVNHHLLCADAAVRQSAYGEVIPACQHAVIDEAHQLEDVATQYFGTSVGAHRVERLARDFDRLAAALGEGRLRAELAGAATRLRDACRAFFDEVARAHRPPHGRPLEARTRATDATLAAVRAPARDLSEALAFAESAAGLASTAPQEGPIAPEHAEDAAALGRRARELARDLEFLVRAADVDFVYFVEFRGRTVLLRASPIDVSRILRELLFERVRATVLTSATLSVDGRFDYVRARLGIDRAVEIRLPPEFDYTRQAILYLPPRMPDPRSPQFPLAAAREIVELLKRSQGRAFVLFTSYATLRQVQAAVELALDYPILVQGTAPRSELLRQFRETPHAVLFATSSFWQGVDVAGDALSCVIIDKLPFASPADPITAARIDAIRARGGEPFAEYQVPLAILALQQGLGRLIRHRRDRGVLAVLDPRLRTKGYGQRFVASLPPAPTVHDLARVEAFFNAVQG